MNLISGIGTIIGSLVQIVLNFLSGLFQMITIIPKAATLLTYSIAQLPPMLLVFATAFITVSVVYLVIDR